MEKREREGRSEIDDNKKQDYTKLNEDRLYRNKDWLYGKRAPIEAACAPRKKRSARSRRACTI